MERATIPNAKARALFERAYQAGRAEMRLTRAEAYAGALVFVGQTVSKTQANLVARAIRGADYGNPVTDEALAHLV